jgi:LysM repeat protein
MWLSLFYGIDAGRKRTGRAVGIKQYVVKEGDTLSKIAMR